jgi:SAM-dependent methyltransferase
MTVRPWCNISATGFIVSTISNWDYWASRSGEDYRLQQKGRREGSNHSYRLQESWLTKFLGELSANGKGRPIRLLDYGCGFGRTAHLVSDLETVEYFGFDFSRSMTAPLRADPPPRLRANIDHHLRVADRLDAVFPASEKFDVILSVSVLIHNQPAAAMSIVAQMLERLATDGVVVLIENPHTAVSALQNFWHGGCWCHSFARYFDGRADVEILDNFAGHGIYIARAAVDPHASRFVYYSSPAGEAEGLDLQTLLLKGLDRAVVNADQLIAEWSANAQDHSALIGRLHDLEELLTTETSKLRNELSLARSRFLERQQLIEGLAAAVDRTAKRFGAVPTRNRPN